MVEYSMVHTMAYTMVLQKFVHVNKKSGGFLGVAWYIPWNIPPCKRTFISSQINREIDRAASQQRDKKIQMLMQSAVCQIDELKKTFTIIRLHNTLNKIVPRSRE
jgi:hypothetical protein